MKKKSLASSDPGKSGSTSVRGAPVEYLPRRHSLGTDRPIFYRGEKVVGHRGAGRSPAFLSGLPGKGSTGKIYESLQTQILVTAIARKTRWAGITGTARVLEKVDASRIVDSGAPRHIPRRATASDGRSGTFLEGRWVSLRGPLAWVRSPAMHTR